jgi:excisionase family DNA binding protein
VSTFDRMSDAQFAAFAAPATESPADDADVMTAPEVATLLRVERKTIYSMVQRGEIPGVRQVGRLLRFSRRRVLAWLAEGDGRAPRKSRAR